MKVKTVSYGRTVSKDYQAKKADVTIELERGDTYDAALAQAKTLVMIALDEAPTAEQIKRAREIVAFADSAPSQGLPLSAARNIRRK